MKYKDNLCKKILKNLSNKKGEVSYVSVVIVFFVILVFLVTFFGYWETTHRIELSQENVQLSLDNYLMDHYSDLYSPLANGGKNSEDQEDKYKRTFQKIFAQLDTEKIAEYMDKDSPYTVTNEGDTITAVDKEGKTAFKISDLKLDYKLSTKYINSNSGTNVTGEVNFQPELVAEYKVETPLNLALVKPVVNFDTYTSSSYKLKYVNEYDDDGNKIAESNNDEPDLGTKIARYTLHFNDGITQNKTASYRPIFVRNLPIPKRDNYMFAGWYKSKLLTGSTYASTPSTYEGDVDYYAKWVNSYHEISNEVKVTFSYYDVLVPSSDAGELNSTPTTYSYTYDGLPGSCFDYYGKDNQKINFSKVIKYAANNTHNPDNAAHNYYYWSSQAEAEEGIQTLPDYHSTPTTNSDGEWVYENYSKQIYHPDTYGNPQTSGEKFVTYYDNEGNEISESDIYEQNANISEVKVWYVNTLKKFKVTAYIVDEDTSEFEENSNGAFVGTKKVIIPNVFYNSNLGVVSKIAQKYGVTNSTPALWTQESFINNDKTYYFQYWAHDKYGNNITGSYPRYTYRVSGNETIYAIYDTKKFEKVGLSTLTPNVNQYTTSAGVKKYKLRGDFTPYNCPDKDADIKKIAVLFIRTTSDAIDNCTDTEFQSFRDNIAKKLTEGGYSDKTGSSVTVGVYPDSDQILQSKVTGYMYPAQGNLSNKNRATTNVNFGASTVKNYSMYQIHAMYYDKINPLTGEKYGWIIGDNIVKFKFDADCNYTITDIVK